MSLDLTVLIAEDQMQMRKIVRLVLQSIGIHRVVETANGVQALMELKNRNRGWAQSAAADADAGRSSGEIDIVIADWAMPGLTGIELLRAVRQEPNLMDLPFIMLTAENSLPQIQEAIALGVTDYVIKPFSTNILEAKIRGVLASQR